MFKPATRLFVVLLAAIAINVFYPSSAKSAISEAEKLLTVAPDDMLGFLATGGADDLKPSFNKTILGRIWNDTEVQTFYQSIKKELSKKIKQEMADPNDVKTFETIVNFAKLALNRPVIIGAVRKDIKADKCPVYGFAILDAGPRKAQIASAITELEALVDNGKIIEVKIGSYTMHGTKKDEGVPAYWGWVGNYLVVAINEGKGAATQNLQKDKKNLMPAYLSKVPSSCDAFVAYGNYEKIFDIFYSIASVQGNEDGFNPVKTGMKELGLDKIRKFVARAGFLGPDVVLDQFVEVPEPRRGLLVNFKNIELSAFDMVDARAMSAAVVNWDAAGMYDTIMNTIRVVSPNEACPQIEQAIAKLESRVKFGIRKGLLESLSGEMVYYTLPAGVIMEVPRGGGVLVAKLKDAVLFEKTMIALQEFAAANSNGLLQVSSQAQNGGTLHTCAIMPLAMMQIIPTWTIVDNYVVAATNMTLCNLAVAQKLSGTNSIRNTEGYKKVTTKLPDNLVSIRYADSRAQFNQLMMGIQQFWPIVTMGAAKAGVKLPFMLPALSHIAKDMGPSCTYSWFDGDGLRAHYQGAGIEHSMGGVAGVSMAAGILMPALAKTRQLADRMVSGTNLSAIGKCCLIYANDHNGKYPDNLQELIEKADLSPRFLISKFKPKGSTEPSYIYIPGQNETMHPGNVIAYDNPKFCPDGVNVLFNDTHVVWMKTEEFLKELEATYKRLGREMPETKFKGSQTFRPLSKPRSKEAKAWELGCAAVLNERNHCRYDTV